MDAHSPAQESSHERFLSTWLAKETPEVGRNRQRKRGTTRRGGKWPSCAILLYYLFILRKNNIVVLPVDSASRCFSFSIIFKAELKSLKSLMKKLRAGRLYIAEETCYGSSAIKINLIACLLSSLQCTLSCIQYVMLSLHSGTVLVCQDDWTPVYGWDSHPPATTNQGGWRPSHTHKKLGRRCQHWQGSSDRWSIGTSMGNELSLPTQLV